MNILIIRKSKLLKYIRLGKSDIKNKKRNENYQLGRFLVRYGAKFFFNLDNVEIVLQGKKPIEKNNLFYFSISHSADVVAVAFDRHDVGLDVELMKERNFQKIAKYLHVNVETPQEFYRYWTSYEAQYKSKKQNLSSFILDDYMFSICSFGDISNTLKIYELVIPKNKTNPNELINLKLVKESSRNENALELQEINTASLDFLEPLSLNIE